MFGGGGEVGKLGDGCLGRHGGDDVGKGGHSWGDGLGRRRTCSSAAS